MADAAGEPTRDDGPVPSTDQPPPPPSAADPPAAPAARAGLRGGEKQWGALAHVAVIAGPVFPVVGGPCGPLVVRLSKGKGSAFVDANAVEALNFAILLAAAQLVV